MIKILRNCCAFTLMGLLSHVNATCSTNEEAGTNTLGNSSGSSAPPTADVPQPPGSSESSKMDALMSEVRFLQHTVNNLTALLNQGCQPQYSAQGFQPQYSAQGYQYQYPVPQPLILQPQMAQGYQPQYSVQRRQPIAQGCQHPVFQPLMTPGPMPLMIQTPSMVMMNTNVDHSPRDIAILSTSGRCLQHYDAVENALHRMCQSGGVVVLVINGNMIPPFLTRDSLILQMKERTRFLLRMLNTWTNLCIIFSISSDEDFRHLRLLSGFLQRMIDGGQGRFSAISSFPPRYPLIPMDQPGDGFVGKAHHYVMVGRYAFIACGGDINQNEYAHNFFSPKTPEQLKIDLVNNLHAIASPHGVVCVAPNENEWLKYKWLAPLVKRQILVSLPHKEDPDNSDEQPTHVHILQPTGNRMALATMYGYDVIHKGDI